MGFLHDIIIIMIMMRRMAVKPLHDIIVRLLHVFAYNSCDAMTHHAHCHSYGMSCSSSCRLVSVLFT